MKRYNIYVLTTVIFTVLYLILAYAAVQIITKESVVILLDNDLKSSKMHSQKLALISAGAFENGVEKSKVIQDIQKSIEDDSEHNIFISIIDWSGKIVSYPDITKVGTIDDDAGSMVSNIKEDISAEDLYAFIDNFKVQDERLVTSQAFRLEPIPGSDLIIVSHIKFKNVIFKLNMFKNRFSFIFIILGLVLLLILLVATRLIKNHYEAVFDYKSSQLQNSVLNLSKLNESLENYQKNIAIKKEEEAKAEKEAIDEIGDKAIKDLPKKRLLTYVRNELMPIAIEDISYIYLENTITYIIRKDGKRFTANDSLDQIYSSLDNKLFFRANRQIIVSIYAIDKIIKFGNNSLKIETKPLSEIDIVIGKNKASAFKQWLDL